MKLLEIQFSWVACKLLETKCRGFMVIYTITSLIITNLDFPLNCVKLQIVATYSTPYSRPAIKITKIFKLLAFFKTQSP